MNLQISLLVHAEAAHTLFDLRMTICFACVRPRVA